MPDASPPAVRRTRSLTIAGIVDVVIGGLGVTVAVVMTPVIGLALYRSVALAGSNPPRGGHVASEAGIAVGGAILVLAYFIYASAFADAWLLATGINLLRRSPRARGTALVHASLMLVLGTIDVCIASHAGAWRWIALACVLPLPIYAVAQFAAFFVVPSWKALNESKPIATIDT